jgi:hypothetical protein
MSVTVGPVSARIAAPSPLVYQMLSAIGQGSGQNGERAEILQQNGAELVCDFWTRVSLPGGFDRLVRTRERVTLRPPDRVEYEHLDGPVRGLTESIDLTALAGGITEMTYRGVYQSRNLLDAVRASLLVRPVMIRVMRDHFEDVRARAEARAARSRVFGRDQEARATSAR